MDKRIWCILKIFLENKDLDYINTDTIKHILKEKYTIDCNLKTIYSDIHKLNLFFKEITGIDVFIKAKQKNGFYIFEDYFSDAQLRFLYDAIASSRSLSMNESQVLFDRLSSLSSYQQINRLGIGKMDKEEVEEIFNKMDVILNAIAHKKSLLFHYVRFEFDRFGKVVKNKSKNGNYKKDKEGETYYVSPYEVMMQSGHYYLLAYNDIRQEQLSIYRIDRMEHIRSSIMPFLEIREMWDMKELKKKAINMYFSNDSSDLKFLFDPSIFRTVVDQFNSQIQVTEDVSGKFVGEVKDTILSDGLIGWIMMLGDHITILEPESLKNKVVERLKASLSNYQL